jgi:hypothetical protein
VVAAVAVALVLIFVVHVFEGSSRPSVKDPVEKLVLRETQVPSGYTLQGHDCANTGSGAGLKTCFASNFRRAKGNETRRLGSAVLIYVDSASASTFLREAKDVAEQTANCRNANGEPVPRSQFTIIDLPPPGLGDESLGLELHCPGLPSPVGEYLWRVDNVVQVVGGPESAETLKDLAEKVEARK